MALLISFALTMAPWAVRNSLVEQTFVPVDSMGGRNFMMGNYRFTPLYRSWDAISITGEEAWYTDVFANSLPGDRTTQGKLDKLALQRGLLFVREHPWLTLQRDIIKFFDFWGLERELIAGAGRGYFGAFSGFELSLLAIVIMGSYTAALFLGIFGIFLCPLVDRRLHLFLILVIAYVCGIHTLVFAHSRYHLPVMPFVLVYTAGAITMRPAFWQLWRSGSFWLAAGLCVFITCGWAWGLTAGDLEKFWHSAVALL